MPAFISKKLSLILLLCAYCASIAVIFTFTHTLTGPKLGRLYDVLLGLRPSPAVSRDILLIETDEIVEPADVFLVLMAINEMGASDLLIEVPVLGSGSGSIESGTEFIYRINDEFRLLGSNIRNLFEAIRMGFISPVEAPAYVDSLVELAQRGRDRLNEAIVRQDGTGSVRAAQAARVFGRATAAVDLRPQSTDTILWYSQPALDPDRILRRVVPSKDIEHIVYRTLKPRWTESFTELTETGLVLVNRFERQGEEAEYRFPLDSEGNLLFEKPGKNNDFRRLPLTFFHEYDRTDRTMARLLKDAETLGVYSETIPEQIPFILFDYAESLKEDLLQDYSTAKHASWIHARLEYIASLDEFLYGPSEMILVNGYEELIAKETDDEDEVIKLQMLRNGLIRAFIEMREQHRQLIDLYTVLARELDSSFCIMGPAFSLAGAVIPESSALLANALLNGRCVTPGQSRHILFWSLAVSLAALICIHALEPFSLLLAGIAASVIAGIAFGAAFVISAYWIDPLIPVAACLGGTLVLTVLRFCIGYGRELRFKLAYSGSVNRDMLRKLVKEGRPLLSETICAEAVIIAVKDHRLPAREDSEKPLEAARAAREFREVFSRNCKSEGAQLLGFEGDIALACFGSPLERAEFGMSSVSKAVHCVTELLNNPLLDECSFGIEAGECAFSWSVEAGYTANGQAVVRARIFASLAKRYNVRAIIGTAAKEAAGLQARKISSLKSNCGAENFYEFKNG